MSLISEILAMDLLYVLSPKEMSRKELTVALQKRPEIKFVSLAGVDLAGNITDEKIPVELFIENIEEFLTGSVQTDGSSVVLPGIATLNNGKLDLVADSLSKWFIDYNYENFDMFNGKPVGTLRIPSFLSHDGIMVDSRHALKRAADYTKKGIKEIFEKHEKLAEKYGFKANDIEEVILTTATELEFWVKTPNKEADVEALSASQDLQESYWKRTKGAVRTALEQSLLMMSKYGFEPEMGHKEVGGIKAKLSEAGSFTHIMEQLEIDWKYDSSLQSIDNEKYVRTLVKEIFRLNGLEVTFDAKPIEGVAGNGKHTHVGIAIKLKDGRRINLFTAKDPKKDFLSELGYGAMMGFLKHYEVINPFISSTIDSLNRLKPGFEAPVCIVCSLGHTVENPSRNRTVLVGLVRDIESHFATRFEVRSPNPNTNTYLSVASIYQSMLNGMKAVIESGKTTKELEGELSKKAGEESFYLEKNRAYRSEDNVFEHFTDSQRDTMFAKPPATVYENIINLTTQTEKRKVLLEGDVMNEKIIMSFQLAITNRWLSEILSRLLPNYTDIVRECKHVVDTQSNELDMLAWAKVNNLRHHLMKDTSTSTSLFTKIRTAGAAYDYETVSKLQIEMDEKINELKNDYFEYKKNLLDIEEK